VGKTLAIFGRKICCSVPKNFPSTFCGKIYAIGGAPNLPASKFPLPALSIVEAYDTGFRYVEAEGKLPTTWGSMKAEK